MTSSALPGDDEPTPDEDGTIRAEFDWSALAPSTAVVETVATATDREPVAMEPLYGTIDPDAIDTLVRSVESGSAGGTIVVSFSYADHDVTVHSTGLVVVRPIAERS